MQAKPSFCNIEKVGWAGDSIRRNVDERLYIVSIFYSKLETLEAVYSVVLCVNHGQFKRNRQSCWQEKQGATIWKTGQLRVYPG